MQKVLVIAVHPDDETLSCGGTLLKHSEQGDEINWLIVTNVDESEGWDRSVIINRQREIETVSGLYGFKRTVKFDLPTTKLSEIPYDVLIKKFSETINEIKPEIIYLPNRSDIHSDHKITFNAAYSCTKNFRYPFIRRIMMCETISETEFAPALPEQFFIPNVFVDIEDQFQKKLDIFKVYASEIMPDPLPRSLSSVEALARVRGSVIGKRFAEAFCLLKEIL